MPFNPDDFINQTVDPMQASPATTFDPDQFLGQHTNPATGEAHPAYADGLSPNSPINKSPIDIADRFRYALGNKQGVLKDLQSKFEAVEQDKYGNFLVKDKGLWYQADAKGLGDGDAFEKSKELVKDIADNSARMLSGATQGAIIGGTVGLAAGGVGAIPGAIAGGVIGAAAPFAADAVSEKVQDVVANNPKSALAAAGGLAAMGIAKNAGAIVNKANVGALIASGVIEGARSSLGRLVGTYDGNEVDQAKDIALEMTFNLAGMTMAAGVKPTAEMTATAVGAAGKALKAAPKATQQLIAEVQGKLTNAGPDRWLRLTERPANIQAEINAARQSIGSNSTDDVLPELSKKGIDVTKKFINRIQPALNNAYVKASNEAASSVDASFEGNVKDLVSKTYSNLAEQKLVVPVKEGSDMFRLANNSELGSAAEEFLKNGEMDKARMLQNLIGNDKAQGFVQKALDVLDAQAGSMKGTSTGKVGAMKVLNFKRAINGTLEDLKSDALEANATVAKHVISMIDGHIDNQLLVKFERKAADGAILPNAYEQIGKVYGGIKQQVQPLLDVQRQAIKQGSDMPYAQALDKVLNSSAKYAGAQRQGLFDGAVAALTEHGDTSLGRLHQRILDIDTAKAFVPKLRPGTVTNAIAGSSVGTAIMSGHPGAAALAAPVALASSPALNRVAINAGSSMMNAAAPVTQPISKAAQVSTEAMFRGKEFLSKLAITGKTKEFLANPVLVQQFYKSVLTAPLMKQQLTDQMVGHAIGQAQPLPAPTPTDDRKQ